MFSGKLMPKVVTASLVMVLALAAIKAIAEDPAPPQPTANEAVIDALVASLSSNKSLPADNVKVATELLSALRSDTQSQPIAVTEALREVYPGYREALMHLGEENIPAAVEQLQTLRKSEDPYLAADANYYLARAYLLSERFEESMPLLTEMQTKYQSQTVRGGESLFLQGVAEAQMLNRPAAVEALTRFLDEYKAAPERMRVGAMRQLEELKMLEDGTLSDVQMRMNFSRRKLSLEDTGKQTREQQDKIIDILAKLIKEAEERESKGSGSGKGKGKGKSQGKGGEGESEGEGQGEGQGGSSGGGSKGTDSDAVKRLSRGGPQSPWSQLRDKERDPVFSAIKEKFPARYQQLIEQYYKSFDDDSGG